MPSETSVSGLVERLREWSRIERVADLPRHPDDTRVADLLDEAASILDRLEVEGLKAAIFEATGTMGMPKPLAEDWSGALAQALISHLLGERG